MVRIAAVALLSALTIGLSSDDAQARGRRHALSLGAADRAARAAHEGVASIMLAGDVGSAPISVRCTRVRGAMARCRVTVTGTTQTLRDTTHVRRRKSDGMLIVWSTDMHVSPTAARGE